MQQYQIYIGGEWLNPSSQQWFESENPFDGKPWAMIPRCTESDVDDAVAAARRAFAEGPWSDMVAASRGALLRKAGDCLVDSAEHLAELETRDTGKRITESLPQIKYIAEWFRYYGGLADKVEGRVIPLDRNDIFNYTLREPLGVVSAITPWNSPVMIAVWKIAPALAAGNTVVVKPSEHASASTIEMMKVFEAAGFPPGVVNVVTGFPQECGERLVSHPDVAKVTFTGSDRGGRQINRIAAESFKRVTMELGGKSPQIVFEDADLESAVNGVISGVFLSNGQTCVAGSRLYLHKAIAERFVNRLSAEMTDLRMGDPFDPRTQLGPIANRAQYDKILSFIGEAKAQGATCVHGGRAAEGHDLGQGLFVEPTIFTDVTPQMQVCREEVFGPVLGIMTFDSEDEVVAMANDTPYGLAAGVWTENIQRAHRMVRRIAAGTVYVNTYRAVNVASPVGGYKASGFGRENGIEAIEAYLQTKSVWFGIGGAMANPLAVAE